MAIDPDEEIVHVKIKPLRLMARRLVAYQSSLSVTNNQHSFRKTLPYRSPIGDVNVVT